MSNIEIITIGRIKSDWIKAGVAHYSRLLSKYRSVGFKTLKEAAGKSDAGECRDLESARVESELSTSDFNVILDATGRGVSSEAFAEFLTKREGEGKLLRFIIGGAYGLTEEVKSKADLLLSFSDFTMPHELSLVVLLEQLYRAYSIVAGSKYHK